MRKSVLCAMLACLLVISKEILAFLPNIELVSFFIIIYALFLPWRMMLMIVFLFSTLQMLLYGIGMWTPMYYIVFSGLALLTICLRFWLTNEYRLALFSSMFGLVFGFLFALPYFLLSWHLGWAYFLNGLLFDVVHAVGNYILMLVLANPVKRTLGMLVGNG